jgi:hypothetical protein
MAISIIALKQKELEKGVETDAFQGKRRLQPAPLQYDPTL